MPYANIEDRKRQRKEWYAKNREHILAEKKAQTGANYKRHDFGVPSGSAEYTRLWKAANPERVKASRAKSYATFRENSNKIEQHNNRNLTAHLRLRSQVLDLLGRECKQCGYSTDERALQIDHIHSDGGEHRKKSSYQQLMDILHDEDRDSKYQTLCANCNWLKRYTNKELFTKYR